MMINIQLRLLFIILTLFKTIKSDCESQTTCDTDCVDQGYYSVDGSITCKVPEPKECVISDHSLCSDPSKFCIGYGFVESSGNCSFPLDCSSNSVGCSEACKLLAYTGSGDCVGLTDSECQNPANKLCMFDKSSCILERGWIQGIDGVCDPPNCTNTGDCNKSACIFIGFIKESNGDCSVPSIDSCLVQTPNKCASYSPCLNINKLNPGTNDVCELPSICESSSNDCTPACNYLNYVTNSSKCELPSHAFCLTDSTLYCSLPENACSKLGWVQKGPSDYQCISPDCSVAGACNKSACVSMGYIKESNGDCTALNIDQCLAPTPNNCASYSLCFNTYKLNAGTNNVCQLPQICESSSNDCTPACIYLNYVTNSSKCEFPTMEFCLTDSTQYCSHPENACTKYGWALKGVSDYQCVLPDCTIAGSCNKQACIQMGYVKESNGDCSVPSIDSCLVQTPNKCASYSPCLNINKLNPGTNDVCELPSICESSSNDCTPACNYLNYVTNSSKCELPSHAFCMTDSTLYCSHSENACQKLGWAKKDVNDYQCIAPNCSSNCSSQACQYLGYINDNGTCRQKSYTECLVTGQNLCQLDESSCIKIGFKRRLGTTDCQYPTNCESNTQECSDICLHLNYVKTSNKCSLPEDQSVCLNGNLDQCEAEERACSVLGWKQVSGNISCEIPNCKSSVAQCSKSVCTYLGYDKNGDQSCKEPSIDDCLESGKDRCSNSLKYCHFYGLIKSATNDCDKPNCLLDEQTCNSDICQYLKYIKDGTQCRIPTIDECQVQSNNNCLVQDKSACFERGFVFQNGSSECHFPTDCKSDTVVCSDICSYLDYHTNGSKCEHQNNLVCIQDNQNHCSIPEKSCRVQGWDKNPTLLSCIQPDCTNSIPFCQKDVCPLLQFIRQGDNTCKAPTLEECLELGKDRCGFEESQCIKVFGLVKEDVSTNCILPTDCLSQLDCSASCIYQGYLKNNLNACVLPTHQECLIPGNSQCSLPLKMCSTFGWVKTSDGLSCEYPDCLTDSSKCQKSACEFLGYIKKNDNTCREPTPDECRETNKNRCKDVQKYCVEKYKFVQNVGDCDLPLDCESRSDKCPVSCNYIGYINDSSPSSLCAKPTNDDCRNQSYLYLCRTGVTFCTQFGWIKSKMAPNAFCILPTCTSDQRCGPDISSSACKQAGYIKSQNNNSCVEPNDDQCKSIIGLCILPTTVCMKRGWENDGNGNCVKPDCPLVGGSYCGDGKTVCALYGFIKSKSSNDCVAPTFEDCADKKNTQLCNSNFKYCTDMGFIKTIEVGKNYCEYPSDCETNSIRCATGQIACLAKGYLKDKTTDKCVKPTDNDCYDTNNQYACFNPSSFCSAQNWKKTATVGLNYCEVPTDCTVNNQCQFQFTACQYIGYVNDYNLNNCIKPTNLHCQDQVFKNLCRPGVTFCTDMGYLKQPDSNKCAIPDCLNGHYCKAGKTACTYNGYISLPDDNCKEPDNNDCFQSTAIKNNQLCRVDILFCTSKGYIRSTANANDNFCVTPTDCKNSQQCASGLTACITIGFIKGQNNDTCYEPSDFDCYDSIKNPDLCKSTIAYCTNKGWIKSSSNNFCEEPSDCKTGTQCAAGKTACLFLGYVSDGSGKCILPKQADCANQGNSYLCRPGNNECINQGWKKMDDPLLNYCVPPPQTDCQTLPLCSPSLNACNYIGFVNNGIDNGCMKPSDKDCLNSAKYPHLCRTDIFFCTGLGYQKHASNTSCIAPTDCLGNLKCGNTNTACIYTGYIPNAPSDITCKLPTTSDCEITTNKYLCRDPNYDCIKKYNYERTSATDQYYCELPKQCLAGGGKCFKGSACLGLGFVKKAANNDCKIPSDSDCQNSDNDLACSDTATYCKDKGWKKTADSGKNFCVQPNDCQSGNQCSSVLTACKYLGYLKQSVSSDQCTIPTDEQCLNSAINANLCRVGVGFCSDRGWVKSPSDNSCIEPADCLADEQCGMGKICLFLGYVKEEGSNKCKIPVDEDCSDINNIYACRTGNTFCTSRGWKKATDPTLNYCIPDVNCLSGNQCDPSLHICKYLGYVTIPGSKKCREPTDEDCANQSNDIACRSESSFCIIKGWKKSSKSTEKFCVSPQCLDGGPYCSSSQTACKFQGYVKKLLNDSCQLPEDEDCISITNNLCAPNINFCTSKGFVKISDPLKNYCTLPSDCLAGEQCSKQLSACRVVGGYVQSNNGNNCVPPDDSDCLNISYTLCRPGIDMCTSRGFVRSTSRQTDRFCVLPDCTSVNDLCDPSLSACTFGGYLRVEGTNNCYAPTDEDCQNQNNKFLCRLGNPVCPSRGWMRNPSNPLEKSCITPSNCLTSQNMCGDKFTACIFSGYLKNPDNNQCIIPSNEQCLDETLNMCRNPQSPCILLKGFKKSASGNNCVYPDNCLTGIQCGSKQVACKLLGYVPTSETFFKCVLPTDDQCQILPLCSIQESLCMKKGYKQGSNGQCLLPDDCEKGQQCQDSLTACSLQNYIKSTTDNACVQPSFSDCLNNLNPNLCKGKNQFCKQFGFIFNDKNGKCEIDLINCAEYSLNLCKDDITFCTSQGWIKQNSDGTCKPPEKCLTGKQCQSEKSPCSILGYISNQDGVCEEPKDCKTQEQCSKYKTVCLQKGYSKSKNDNSCICVSNNEKNNSCSAEGAQIAQTTSSIKLSLYLISFILYFIIVY